MFDDYSDLMSRKQKKIVRRIGNSAERIANLVDSMHIVLQKNDAEISNKLRTFNINNALREILDGRTEVLNKLDIAVQFDESEQPLLVKANAQQMRNALNNLMHFIEKQIDYDGSLKIELQVYEDDKGNSFASVNIFDTQTTFTADDIAKLFSAIPQIDAKDIDEVNLLYTKSVINALGGQLWVDSDAQTGTVYRVLIPLIDNYEND